MAPIHPYPSSAHRTRVLLAALVLLAGIGAAGYHWAQTPSVFLTVNGQTRSVRTKAATVRTLLTEQQVTLDPDDLVTPDFATPLSRDMTVKVTRVTAHDKTVVFDVPTSIDWQVRTSQNLRRVQVLRGMQNQRRQTVHVTLYDGKEVERKVTVQKIVRKPLYTISLLNDQGDVEKTYNLRDAKKFKMLATAYYVGDPMVPGDTTYLGHKLRRGLVAIDPTVLPLGWRLYIPGYGYAYSSDTGSAIKGLRIDLAVKNRQEELRYNHRMVTIYLLEKSKTW